MAPPTLPGPDETQDDAQWRTAGERIQTLLDASSSGGAVARERAEQLVREVTDLYGAVLERMMVVAFWVLVVIAVAIVLSLFRHG